MIIDIVKKSTKSKILKFLFHDILKINLGELTLPRIFIFKLNDLKFDLKIFCKINYTRMLTESVFKT